MVRQAAAGSSTLRPASSRQGGGNNLTRTQSGAQQRTSSAVATGQKFTSAAKNDDEDDEFSSPDAVQPFNSNANAVSGSPPRQRTIPPASARTTYSPHSPQPSKPPPPIGSSSSSSAGYGEAAETKSANSPARRGRARHLGSQNDEDDEEFFGGGGADNLSPDNQAQTAANNDVGSFEPSAAAQFSRPGAAKRAQTLQNDAAGNNRAGPSSSVVSPPTASSALGGGGGGGGILSGGPLSRPRTAVGTTAARARFATGGFANDSFDDEDDDDAEDAARRARQAAQPLGVANDSAPSTAQKQQQQQEEKKQEPTEQKKAVAADLHPRDAARVLNPRRAAGGMGSLSGMLGAGGARPGTSVGSRPPTTMSSGMLTATGRNTAALDSEDDVSDVSSVVNLSEGESNKGSKQQQDSSTAAKTNAATIAVEPSVTASILGGSIGGGPIVQGRGRPRSQAGKLGTTTAAAASKPPPPTSNEDSLSSLLGGGLGSGFGGGARRPPGRGLSSGSNFRSKLMQPAVNDYSEGDSSLDLND